MVHTRNRGVLLKTLVISIGLHVLGVWALFYHWTPVEELLLQSPQVVLMVERANGVPHASSNMSSDSQEEKQPQMAISPLKTATISPNKNNQRRARRKVPQIPREHPSASLMIPEAPTHTRHQSSDHVHSRIPSDVALVSPEYSTPRPNVRILPNWLSRSSANLSTPTREYKTVSLKKTQRHIKEALDNDFSVAEQEVMRKIRAYKKKIFHRYFVGVHEKHIHPHFADHFLVELNDLSPKHPLNQGNLKMYAEIEISRDGQIEDVRVVRSSGNSEYDAGAVKAIYDASPLPPPPKSILSWDGKVYVQWGFFRNHRKCGIFNVEPYLLDKRVRTRVASTGSEGRNF